MDLAGLAPLWQALLWLHGVAGIADIIYSHPLLSFPRVGSSIGALERARGPGRSSTFPLRQPRPDIQIYIYTMNAAGGAKTPLTADPAF
jgi:hypothetical protein